MRTAVLEPCATTTPTAKKRSAPLDPQVADRLLDLPSTNNAFRRLFKRNPGKALEQLGFVASTRAPSPVGCFFGISKLASKTQISEGRETIKTMLTGGLALTSPQLDAGNNTARRTRK